MRTESVAAPGDPREEGREGTVGRVREGSDGTRRQRYGSGRRRESAAAEESGRKGSEESNKRGRGDLAPAGIAMIHPWRARSWDQMKRIGGILGFGGNPTYAAIGKSSVELGRAQLLGAIVGPIGDC